MSVLYKHNDEIERVAGSYRPYVINPRPDWANAVAITKEQVVAGYTVPSDGMIVGYGIAEATSERNFSVNNVVVSRSVHNYGRFFAYANTQVPVSKGDIFKSEGALNDADYHFVPWK